MSDPFVAEIKIFAGNFAPKGWATCDGQIIPISQNTALFSLLGTTYGGDGKSNFALPNLQGMAPMHPGDGHGLSNRYLGETGGTTAVTLLNSEIPAHNHALQFVNDVGDINTPQNFTMARSSGGAVYNGAGVGHVAMSPLSLSNTGGGQAHNNMQPYLTLMFIIAMQGIYPQRP